jgi:hypothetical protein
LRGGRNTAERRLVHAAIRNNGGSVERYHHFVFGYLLPVCAYLSRRTGEPPLMLVRECGPMNRLIGELKIPGLMLCNRQSLAKSRDFLTGDAQWEHVEVTGVASITAGDLLMTSKP